MSGGGGRPARRGRRALLVLTSAACLAGCLSWVGAMFAWPFDMVAVFLPHVLAVTGVVALVCIFARVRPACIIIIFALGFGLVGTFTGRDLFASGPAAPGEQTLRVLVFNAHALNAERDACAALIRDVDADVVVLIEPEIEFSRWIRWDRALEGEYPHMFTRDWVKHTVSPIIVLSRLPAAELGFGHAPASERFMLGVDVETEFGPVTVMAGQPRSPRNAARWAAGNHEARLHAGSVQNQLKEGVPVLYCADLNSTPAAHRGGLLRAAGLTPCKPLLRAQGTYPASLPWPMRIAIDDVWRSEDLRVLSWETVGPAGSDHMGVVVEVAPR